MVSERIELCACCNQWLPVVSGPIKHCALCDNGVLAFFSGFLDHFDGIPIAEVWNTATGERMAKLVDVSIVSAAFFTLKSSRLSGDGHADCKYQ
jgi:hypothetical protein